MPVWGWILLIAFLSALAVGAVMAIVHATHHRMPTEDPQHGDPANFADPLPHRVVSELDSMTEREIEAEDARTNSRRPLSRNR